YREPFRPFAPSILAESAEEWFDLPHDRACHAAPYMLVVAPFLAGRGERVPAVRHVDGTGRLQTVSSKSNPLYAKLISSFEDASGVPIVLNTSFNENEPVVNTPAEALDCFLRTKMDLLVMGDLMIQRV
ncbi:MAG TPA: carbamoyltransferase C-terminal domain-containing protein, partial [Thermoanaerobaculia bacterium]|nr:carbamoyltransferase C-terminal domain-containing protein [Thermoanaerobaculia bacterium]